MKPVLLSALAFLAVLALCALVAWLGGHNFDARNADVAFATAASLALGALVASSVYSSTRYDQF